jgi:hypothetical protein
MDEMQATVVRAYSKVEEVYAVLLGASDCQGRATALQAWRVQQGDALAKITSDIKRYSLDALKPVILAESGKHKDAAAAIELAKECSKDPAFMAEWKLIYDLFGG